MSNKKKGDLLNLATSITGRSINLSRIVLTKARTCDELSKFIMSLAAQRLANLDLKLYPDVGFKLEGKAQDNGTLFIVANLFGNTHIHTIEATSWKESTTDLHYIGDFKYNWLNFPKNGVPFDIVSKTYHDQNKHVIYEEITNLIEQSEYILSDDQEYACLVVIDRSFNCLKCIETISEQFSLDRKPINTWLQTEDEYLIYYVSENIKKNYCATAQTLEVLLKNTLPDVLNSKIENEKKIILMHSMLPQIVQDQINGIWISKIYNKAQ